MTTPNDPATEPSASPDQDATVGPDAGHGGPRPSPATSSSSLDPSPMSATADGPLTPMSFEPAAELLRKRVLDPPTHPGVLANVDRFEVLRVLGSGGMGVVVLARQPVGGGGPVAIKLLKPELVADPRAVRQFLVEARHMSRLDHPRLLKVAEVSERPQGPYYVMPYLERGPLSRLIRAGEPLDAGTVRRVAEQAADGIAHAHARGLIHRDLKPSNVLLDAEGNAYVSDFGLVRTVYNDSVLDVRQSQCAGTAPYMSPAVARGEAEDTRCDIYAIGATMYEMLTGRPPYAGRGSAEVIAKVLAGPPAPILTLNPEADPALVRIAEGAMARDLRDRYAQAADIAEDLRRVGRHNPPCGPRGRPEQSVATGRGAAARHGLRAVAIVLCVAVVGLAAWAAWWALRRDGVRDAAAPPATPGTAAAPAVGPNSLTDAERAAGWKLLFDGRTTIGWRGFRRATGTPGWEVVDGALAHTGGEADLVTDDVYDSFDLVFDWRVSAGANSGVIYRFSEAESSPWLTGPEMQVVDNDGHPDGRNPMKAAGSCFELYAATRDVTEPAGEWNRGRLLVDGTHVEHWLNGVKVVEYDLGSPEWTARVAARGPAQHPMLGKVPRGPICLQGYAGRVEFRNIKIRTDLHPTGAAQAPKDGSSVDLIALVNPEVDTLAGRWTKDAGGLRAPRRGSSIVLPYKVPEEYDFTIEFTVGEEPDSVDQIISISHGSRVVIWTWGGWKNTIAGLSSVDGRMAHENGTAVPNTLSPGRHTATIQVRNESITAIFDGREVKHYPTDYSRLSTAGPFEEPGCLGLCVLSPTVFHKATVTPVTR